MADTVSSHSGHSTQSQSSQPSTSNSARNPDNNDESTKRRPKNKRSKTTSDSEETTVDLSTPREQGTDAAKPTGKGSLEVEEAALPSDRSTAPQDLRLRNYREAHDRKSLGVIEVTAFIMNKMIGAGIFTTPALVFQLTGGSLQKSIGLWILGGIYSLISFSVYLELGLNLPFNGGDLVYLDHLWRRPYLLSTVLYSTFFVCFATTAPNSIAFSRLIYASYLPPDSSIDVEHYNKAVINLMAVCIVSLVCILLYYSRETARALNIWLMIYKTALLLTVFIVGVAHRKHCGRIEGDMGKGDSKSTVSAFIFVIYSYEGWENANYLTGEIKGVNRGTLKWGGYIAVTTTMVLYVLASLGYYLACPTTTKSSDVTMARDLTRGTAVSVLQVCMALSAIGNMVGVIFTYSVVKQSIALRQFIPFYKLIADDAGPFLTPGGAIFLQWLVTIIYIVLTPQSSDGYGFVIGMYSYPHTLFLALIGIFVLWKLPEVMTELTKPPSGKWKWKFLKNPIVRWLILLLFIATNLLVLVASALPSFSDTFGDPGTNSTRNATSNTTSSTDADADPKPIPKYFWPIATGSALLLGLVYWIGLCFLQEKRFLSRWFGVDAEIHQCQPNVGTGGEKVHLKIQHSKSRRRSEPVPQITRTTPRDAVLYGESARMVRDHKQDDFRHYIHWTIREGIVKNAGAVYGKFHKFFLDYILKGPDISL